MTPTRWGIIGPGAIAHNFADGLAECQSGVLAAVASRNQDRLDRFSDRYQIPTELRFNSYPAMAESTSIDAIYISVPHPWHAELAIMAMRAGKPVLCEKPAGMTAAEVAATIEVAAQESVFFMEAYMYRAHPQIARVLELIQDGVIGEVQHIDAAFGFAAEFDADSRLFDLALGGGAILDVGGYPMSFARLIAGAATGQRCDDPSVLKGIGTQVDTGVDNLAMAHLVFASGVTAACRTAVTRNLDNGATITGSQGCIHLPNPWMPGRDAGPSDAEIHITSNGDTRVETLKLPEHLFTFEAELASRAIADGLLEAPAPAMNWADSLGNAVALDQWRHEVGYVAAAEMPEHNRVVPKVWPGNQPDIPRLKIPGVELAVSQLVLGCDNRNTLSEGALVWDAWLEAGGNAFDTARIYGNGLHETLLGEWMRSRGVSKEVVVIGKGAHSPYCTPRTLATELEQSQAHLGLEHTPIYIMHRDNPQVPVGEFVDALNQLHAAGRIGIFGGSNWSIERLIEANRYAAANGLKGMSLLNNNLSLAVMQQPVWPDCRTSNDTDTRAFLEQEQLLHLSWSSQARGYFLPEDLRNRLPEETAPETCFGGPDNAERRRRAETLAAERGVEANAIALAWVLQQPFPSVALIGPRSPGEIVSTLPALAIELSTAEHAWLNLDATDR